MYGHSDFTKNLFWNGRHFAIRHFGTKCNVAPINIEHAASLRYRLVLFFYTLDITSHFLKSSQHHYLIYILLRLFFLNLIYYDVMSLQCNCL